MLWNGNGMDTSKAREEIVLNEVRSVAHWMVKEVKKEMKKEFHSESHTFLIQYTPPQHMLVMMPFDEGRSLRQSVYDLIECTGGGVEMLFEQGSCYSFEEYDQEAWRIGMEDIENVDWFRTTTLC
eukprot:gnl/Carplike_NY0171/1374_a1867_314.p1 GENE.gnl/Carplike_NY0171/1374_a1867_314~~gnl/Carplike_NY0171/1374_a1867_314.p1  ORF type:complete len:125 (-),score=30.31 gnl/Carplike_NY0171/1374_a1867_314:164-538(-)